MARKSALVLEIPITYGPGVRRLANVGECLAELKAASNVLVEEANRLRYEGNYRLAFQIYLESLEIEKTRLEYLKLITKKKLARGALISVTRILTENFDFEGPTPAPFVELEEIR